MPRLATRHQLITLLASTTFVLAACGGAPPAPTAAPKTEAKPTEAPKPAAASPAPAAASPAAAAAASPATVASPAAAASPAASPGASPSPAAAASPNVSGEVDAVDGRTLTVATNTGIRTVRVADTAVILKNGVGTPADLVPGSMVGVTGKTDGTAISIQFFPPGISPKPSQFPMTGAQTGNIMTNASIVSFDGSTLTVDLGGEKVTLTVPPDTRIVRPQPSTFAEIKPGLRVFAVGAPEGDVLVAQTVTITTPPS